MSQVHFWVKFVKCCFMRKMSLELWRLFFSRSLNYWAKIVTKRLAKLFTYIKMCSLFLPSICLLKENKWLPFYYVNLLPSLHLFITLAQTHNFHIRPMQKSFGLLVLVPSNYNTVKMIFFFLIKQIWCS